MKRFRLVGAVRIRGRGLTKGKRFEMLAYSGGLLRIEGFALPVIVDLDSIHAPKQQNPVLRDHNVERPIGHTDLVEVSASGIWAEGAFSLENEDAGEVIRAAKMGFPWQASIGADPDSLDTIAAGDSVRVNGRLFRGPVYVARGVELREISFVAVGADRNATVRVAAKMKGQAMTFEEWVKSLGFDPATLTEEQLKKLEETYAVLFPDAGDDVTDPPTNAAAAVPLRTGRVRRRHRVRQRGDAELERARIDNINAALSCLDQNNPEVSELRAQAIAGEITPSVMRASALCLLRASRHPGPAPMTGNHFSLTANHLAAAIMVKANFEKAAEKAFGAQVMEQSKKYHRAHLLDLARTALNLDRKDVPDGREPMIKAALSGGTLTNALDNSANKILIATYMAAPSAWRAFALVKSAANFQPQKGIRPSFLGNLVKTPRGAGIDHASVGEETYNWKVDQFARQLQVDRQDFINDELAVFGEVLPAFGKAAARTLNDLVAETILANAASFWSTANKNYFEGAATSLQASSLATAVQKLRQMKDLENDFLDLEPRVLVVPPELEVTGRELLESTEVQRFVSSGIDRSPMGNALRAVAALAVEPRLSDVAFTGFSTTAWYLFSAAENGAVIVGFLDGRDAPVLESFGLDHDVNVLAYQWRVYHDFGVALADKRASVKSKGAA
ncbi:MAG: Mu-like prophage major head subunit gpT family protein [Gemmataceae bacterium]|nr:Mu-like prophage major head subunit gpT family protein [Gemmataceae bacterium]